GYRVPTFIRTCADECGRCSDKVDNQGYLDKARCLQVAGISLVVFAIIMRVNDVAGRSYLCSLQVPHEPKST
ncbi:hypothetical protein, partial [Collinsella aerofaciens]|uniref:hypothetical protein n=1 Tax=Collinsella aerofaciens TaxID=74426 RepID=UPI00232AE5CC